MKAIDTNVLVRYLVQDDPVQGRKAASFIESAAAVGDQILIGNIVLCELVWVLDSAYGYSKPEISASIEKLLQTGTFKFEAKDTARAALEEYRAAKVDFADCLLGRLHKEFGCEVTMTFDAALRKRETFQLLRAGPANVAARALRQHVNVRFRLKACPRSNSLRLHALIYLSNRKVLVFLSLSTGPVDDRAADPVSPPGPECDG